MIRKKWEKIAQLQVSQRMTMFFWKIFWRLSQYFSKLFFFFRLRPATLLKKRLWQMRFPVNFAKFLRKPPVATSEQIAFELIPAQAYGRISQKFWWRGLLKTMILAKKIRRTVKMTCYTFVFLQILLAGRAIRSFLTQLILSCYKLLCY